MTTTEGFSVSDADPQEEGLKEGSAAFREGEGTAEGADRECPNATTAIAATNETGQGQNLAAPSGAQASRAPLHTETGVGRQSRGEAKEGRIHQGQQRQQGSKAQGRKKTTPPAVLTPHEGSIPADQGMLLLNRNGAPGVITLIQRGRITSAINLTVYKAAPCLHGRALEEHG